MSPRKSARNIALAKAAVALTLIWALAAGGIALARAQRLTADDVIAYLRQHPPAQFSPPARAEVIREAARQLNRLEFEDARKVQQSRALFIFYRPLEPAEKERFAELIVLPGLRRILDTTLKLPREERAAFLERALYYAVLDLSIAEPPIDPEALKRIEQDALRTYVQDLSLADRFELEAQLQQIRDYLHPPR